MRGLRGLLLPLLLAVVLATDDATRCCWCGKRYVPKEGYYEGSASAPDECAEASPPRGGAQHGGGHGGRLALGGARHHGLRTPPWGGFPMGWFVSWGGWMVRLPPVL
jgi:hypothetical protein